MKTAIKEALNLVCKEGTYLDYLTDVDFLNSLNSSMIVNKDKTYNIGYCSYFNDVYELTNVSKKEAFRVATFFMCNCSREFIKEHTGFLPTLSYNS